MFGRVNEWQNAKLKVVSKKLGEWIDFSHMDTIYKLKFANLAQITDDPPNLPNFSAAKHFHYMVQYHQH